MTEQFTKSEVANHCTHDDLWIIFRSKVYNVTKYFDKHPGGLAILRRAGQDVSTILPFVPAHGMAWNTIVKKLDEFLIGDVKP